MIFVTDNCHPSNELEKKPEKNPLGYTKAGDVKHCIRVTLSDYLSDKKDRKLLSLIADDEKTKNKNLENELIIQTFYRDGKYYVETGNYLGRFNEGNVEINIQSRFGNLLIKRMLSFANDVYLNDIKSLTENDDTDDLSKFILYYLFLQSLEKAYLLGLPKVYQSVQHHEPTLKGRFDVQRYIKNDIPFLGKLSSTSRELKEDQNIVDVLNRAVRIIEKELPNLTTGISHIKPHLKSHCTKKYVSQQMINQAKASKPLRNTLYAPYKKVLRYAEYIIQLNALKDNNISNKENSAGFLINVAELFEIYVSKLLQRNFPDWSISSPKIPLYETNFYSRKIIPDIVMEKDDAVIVFDTKYKRMRFQGKNTNGLGDVDRNDFFQINTYMSYYQKQQKNLLGGGLLYPLSETFKATESHSEYWLSTKNTKTWFVIDGIEVNDSKMKIDTLIENEKAFINRIKELAAQV